MNRNFLELYMPYGIEKNDKGEWYAFNRGHNPLGFSYKELSSFDKNRPEVPVMTKFNRLSDEKWKHLYTSENMVQRDKEGDIVCLYLYGEGKNKLFNFSGSLRPKQWEEYIIKLEALASWNVKKN